MDIQENIPELPEPLICYDGHCRFCNFWIQKLICLPAQRPVYYAPIQSAAGKKLLAHYPAGLELDEVLLLDQGVLYGGAGAILKILEITGRYPLIRRIMRNIPKSWQNRVYRLISKYRHTIFGKQEQCFLPHPAHNGFVWDETKQKFIRMNQSSSGY